MTELHEALLAARAAFDARDFAKAEQQYEALVEHAPNDPEILLSSAQAAMLQRNFQVALDRAERAIQRIPDHDAAIELWGFAAAGAGDRGQEISAWQRLINLQPDRPDGFFRLAAVYAGQGRHAEADAMYEAALQRAPEDIELQWARCFAALWTIFGSEEERLRQRAIYRERLVALEERFQTSSAQQLPVWNKARCAITPYNLSNHLEDDRELQTIFGRLAGQIAEAAAPPEALAPIAPKAGGRRLRIGVVSAYFTRHTVGKLFRGWFEYLDRDRFELIFFDTDPGTDPYSLSYHGLAEQHICAPTDSADLARTIRQAECDALIYPEIGQNPDVAAAAALRLAPVQAATWGHILTTGYASMDYFLSGELIESTTSHTRYTEELVRLPNISLCYEPTVRRDPEAVRSALNLPEDKVLFLCAQMHYKYLPRHDHVIPEIARRTPDATFVFLNRFTPAMSDRFRMRLYRAFRDAGLDPAERVIFLDTLSFEDYRTLNSVCDIFLDSLLWSGAMSTLEALDFGLPIVTMAGDDIRGLQSAGMLRMMGLDKYVTNTVDEFIELASTLGNDTDLRQRVTQEFNTRTTLLYDDRSCVRGLEDFLTEACRKAATQQV